MSETMPRQGSAIEQYAQAIDNKTLASKIGHIQHNRRAYPKAEADAYLAAAAQRLNWPDVYEKH